MQGNTRTHEQTRIPYHDDLRNVFRDRQVRPNTINIGYLNYQFKSINDVAQLI